MAVESLRSISIQFIGDVVSAKEYAASSNVASPGQIQTVQLASGANTITPPSSGVTSKACTIIMPAGNVNTVTLKGVTGDTGVVLSPTEPTTIALNSPSASFVLTASAAIDGVRLIWT